MASTSSSAEGARIMALHGYTREDQAYSDHQSLEDQACSDDLSQEEADAITDEADQAQLDQEQQDEAYARRLTEEETSISRRRSANRETANKEAGTGQLLRTNILLQPTEEISCVRFSNSH
jgi:predicted nucleotidyltransferase